MIKKYILDLKKFVENDFVYTLNDDVLTVREDNEISYEYDFRKKKIYRIERADCREIQRFCNDKLLRLEFAFILMGFLGKSRNNDKADIFAKKNNLEEIKNISKEYFAEKYYSIGTIEKNKISLISEENYKIIFRYKNVDYVIEDDSDKEIVFRMFYREISYAEFFEYNINRYINIFNETFTTDEIMRFWGYPIGIR